MPAHARVWLRRDPSGFGLLQRREAATVVVNPAARMVGAAAVAFLPCWGLNAALMRTHRAQSSRMGRTHARNVTCNHCLRQAMDMAGCR